MVITKGERNLRVSLIVDSQILRYYVTLVVGRSA